LNVLLQQQPAWMYRSSNNLLERTVAATTCLDVPFQQQPA